MTFRILIEWKTEFYFLNVNRRGSARGNEKFHAISELKSILFVRLMLSNYLMFDRNVIFLRKVELLCGGWVRGLGHGHKWLREEALLNFIEGSAPGLIL